MGPAEWLDKSDIAFTFSMIIYEGHFSEVG